MLASAGPSSPRRPNASSSATPATAGGTTTGSCTSISSARPARVRQRASNHASGVPATTMNATAIAVVNRLRRSAGPTSGCRSPPASSAGDAVSSRPASGSTSAATSTTAGTASAAVHAASRAARSGRRPRGAAVTASGKR